MYACAFFGHRDYDYEKNINQIEDCIIDLIKNKGVTKFYAGARGNFDWVCIRIVYKLKEIYPNITCTRVWSYIPKEENEQERKYFDDSVYLLERKVPPLYAIAETNKILVEKMDYVLSGVLHTWGGAWAAVEHAKKKEKKVIMAFEKCGQ